VSASSLRRGPAIILRFCSGTGGRKELETKFNRDASFSVRNFDAEVLEYEPKLVVTFQPSVHESK
jgi:hypothetical protein